jgi:hypothetical protein
MCGVADTTVETYRPVNIGNTEVERRTGLDGKDRPAHREPAPLRACADREEGTETPPLPTPDPQYTPLEE